MIETRKARAADMPRVLELITELAVFEKEPEAVEVTVEELVAGLEATPAAFTCFVGLYDDHIEGMALCYPRFSTWKGTTIHLEDLIVTDLMRGKGLGKALYRRVLQHAHELRVRRVEWVVLDWNKPAIAFYQNSGATMAKDWYLAQMDGRALAQFIGDEDI